MASRRCPKYFVEEQPAAARPLSNAGPSYVLSPTGGGRATPSVDSHFFDLAGESSGSVGNLPRSELRKVFHSQEFHAIGGARLRFHHRRVEALGVTHLGALAL